MIAGAGVATIQLCAGPNDRAKKHVSNALEMTLCKGDSISDLKRTNYTISGDQGSDYHEAHVGEVSMNKPSPKKKASQFRSERNLVLFIPTSIFEIVA